MQHRLKGPHVGTTAKHTQWDQGEEWLPPSPSQSSHDPEKQPTLSHHGYR